MIFVYSYHQILNARVIFHFFIKLFATSFLFLIQNFVILGYLLVFLAETMAICLPQSLWKLHAMNLKLLDVSYSIFYRY
jgi:hypothetical protein